MKKTKFSKIIWGLLFIVAAGLIVLHIFGLLGGVNTWTLLISIPVIIGILYSAIQREWSGMFLLAAVLAFIYRRQIESALAINLNLFALFGIATLLGIGFHILFGKKKGKTVFGWNTENCGINFDTEHLSGDTLHFEERFSGSAKQITSENLSYISIKNSFGGMEVYFTNATLASEGAVAEIHNSFGGVDLYIPRGWNIVDQINNLVAGVDSPKRSWADGAPTLTLRGTNKCGGIDVTFV